MFIGKTARRWIGGIHAVLENISLIIFFSKRQHNAQAQPKNEPKILHFVHACNVSLQFTENFLKKLNEQQQQKETTLL